MSRQQHELWKLGNRCRRDHGWSRWGADIIRNYRPASSVTNLRGPVLSCGPMRFGADLLCLLSMSWLACATPKGGATNPLGGTKQLVVVRTAGWNATEGTLSRFVRRGADDAWRRVAGPAPVVVGRSGLGWGRGLHAPQPGGPTKREGDGRAPAGVFRLSTAFGYQAAGDTERLPY